MGWGGLGGFPLRFLLVFVDSFLWKMAIFWGQVGGDFEQKRRFVPLKRTFFQKSGENSSKNKSSWLFTHQNRHKTRKEHGFHEVFG